MRRARLVLASVLLTAAAVVPGVLLAGGPAPPPRPVAAAAPASDPRSVLAAWDERRAAAWAAGDRSALRRLYVPGSAAGRADRAMLRRWTDRGLRVVGLRVEVRALEVVAESHAWLRVRVTDRVAAGRAVGRGVDTALPRDRATTRSVTLVRVAGEWRVGEVV